MDMRQSTPVLAVACAMCLLHIAIADEPKLPLESALPVAKKAAQSSSKDLAKPTTSVKPTRKRDLLKLGYISVMDYSGVRNDGDGDSTKGIQDAIDDAFEKQCTVLFPPGTYIISDTLRCYKFRHWNKKKNTMGGTLDCFEKGHAILGSYNCREKPIIKLAEKAPLFDHKNKPRPMISVVVLSAKNCNADTSISFDFDPINPPEDYAFGSAVGFNDSLRNVEFDCSNHKGAVGVHFPAAQDSYIADVKVDATNAHTGIMGLPGRNMGAANIEIIGGDVGIDATRTAGCLSAGSTLVGVTLINQEESAILYEDFSPGVVVGFSIVKEEAPVIKIIELLDSSCFGVLNLIDGRIEVKRDNGKPVIDNSTGNFFYARNVYITGTESIIKSGNKNLIKGRGKWKRIREYQHNRQVAENTLKIFKAFNIINGEVNQSEEPYTRIEEYSEAAPADIVKRHIWSEALPFYDGSDEETKCITDAPYNAVPDDGNDDLSAIQQAIDDAENSGHGKVFIPKGRFEVSDTIMLKAKTKLFGAGKIRSEIFPHSSWKPETGMPSIIRTVDDKDAETFLGFLAVRTDPHRGPEDDKGVKVYNRYNQINWRAGRKSMTLAPGISDLYIKKGFPSQPKSMLIFSGNGGGKHYFHAPLTRTFNRDLRHVLINNTTEPLFLYGPNAEGSKGTERYRQDSNLEAINSKNIRIYCIKREGSAPTLILRNCRNVAFFGSGAMRTSVAKGFGAYLQVLGDSDNITITNAHVQKNDTKDNEAIEPMLSERIDGSKGVEVMWPNGIGLYKRGELN